MSVKPVLSGHSKIDKTTVFKTNVLQNALFLVKSQVNNTEVQ